MSKLCDLHTHSNYSDGSFTPAQLVSEAERAGLAAIALTDHNTVLGLPDFLAAGQGSSVEPMALVVASPRSALTKAKGWPLSHWGGGYPFWRWKSNVFLK